LHLPSPKPGPECGKFRHDRPLAHQPIWKLFDPQVQIGLATKWKLSACFSLHHASKPQRVFAADSNTPNVTLFALLASAFRFSFGDANSEGQQALIPWRDENDDLIVQSTDGSLRQRKCWKGRWPLYWSTTGLNGVVRGEDELPSGSTRFAKGI